MHTYYNISEYNFKLDPCRFTQLKCNLREYSYLFKFLLLLVTAEIYSSAVACIYYS